MSLGSDATGDLYYRNSSGNLTRLGIGANNYVVTSNGTTPVWGPNVGGGMTYLCTITANNSTSLNNASPTSGSCPINSTYTSYKLVFENLAPATNERIMELQVHSANGGASYKTSGYLTSYTQNYAGTTSGAAPTTYFPLSYPSASQGGSIASGAPGLSGTVTIFAPAGGGLVMITIGDGGYLDGSGDPISTSVSGYWNTAAAVDGFQVLMDSGNLTSGSILVYGVQ